MRGAGCVPSAWASCVQRPLPSPPMPTPAQPSTQSEPLPQAHEGGGMSSCLQPRTLQADLRSVCGLLKSTPTLMRKWTGSLLSVSQTQRRAMGRHCWLT